MTEVKKENLKERPPVVVVMGHVDHGKTTLLDYVRKANVAAREAGGITQSIGAYEIVHNGKRITFIDTPGHEAFTAMRSRGAEVADLAILVVASDEGVKPQTKEAVDILLRSNTPFVVAINKIDKTNDLEKVKNDLTSAGVLLEGYGGQVSWHGVSAKTGEGVNELLDLVVLASSVEHLTFDSTAPASGYILETRVDRKRGNEATLIVKNGVLRRGEEIHTATGGGKVKILEDFLGNQAAELEPSAPALTIGLEKLPRVGEEFQVGLVPQPAAPKPAAAPKAATPPKKDGKQLLNLVLKASDAGSLEALSLVVRALGSAARPLAVLDESAGDITDGDVKRAIPTHATIIGFRNKLDKGAKNLAEAHEIRIITSEIIYDLVKAVEEFLLSLDKPKALGELEVLAVFNQAKPDKQLVGGKVVSGTFRNKVQIEITRKSGEGDEWKTVGNGRVLSLRDKKADVSQTEQGKEAGLMVNAPMLIQVGDRLAIRK
ncbi:GTP-binding protein [Candidatus Parcubacteria bacterium]|nr:MAG: GTP-binding protein [Candidatus Parcubacteria bacterium]